MHFKELMVLQKRAIRLVFNCKKTTPSSPLFHDLAILPLKDALQYKIINFMNKYVSYGKPDCVAGNWTDRQRFCDYNFRDDTEIFVPRLKSDRIARHPLFSFATTFNNFPEEYKSILEREDFLREHKKHFFKKQDFNVCEKPLCKICDEEGVRERIFNFAENHPIAPTAFKLYTF